MRSKGDVPKLLGLCSENPCSTPSWRCLTVRGGIYCSRSRLTGACPDVGGVSGVGIHYELNKQLEIIREEKNTVQSSSLTWRGLLLGFAHRIQVRKNSKNYLLSHLITNNVA